MSDLLTLILSVGSFLVLLTMGYAIGRMNERAHLRQLVRQEHELGYMMISDMRRLPDNWNAEHATLVTGTAVIATDYFKTFAASLRNLFGGEVRSYVTLVERARRQAIVRMLREAQAYGANVVWNVRLETSTIGGRQGANGVEVIAYGTCMLVR